MIKYVKKIIDAFSEEINSTSNLPALDHPFQIKEESEAMVISEEQAVEFHNTVAQLLFMSERDRKDIQTALDFLTTCVKNPNEDNWG